MKLLVLTPAPSGSKAGNRATAERWATLLKAAGYDVVVATDYDATTGAQADALIALHAWRSHSAIMEFHQRFPEKPLVTALTGTDIYQFQFSHPVPTLASMTASHCLIGLHRLVSQDIPAQFRSRLRTVLQSAEEPSVPPKSHPLCRQGRFNVCVVGHLRREKDSLRTAMAARLLPAHSAIYVLQAGKAHDDTWKAAALEEEARNSRFQWLGEIEREDTQALMLSSQAMVISSVMEGGANVVSEACRAGLPILASDIAGNRGLLGDDYPGYFPAGNEKALAALLHRTENDPEFLESLRQRVATKVSDFTPAAERAALVSALDYAFSAIGSIASS